MNHDLTKQYYVLGLQPGASAADMKAAHRDLAKVWHPDRFVHDPQLRQKAEQKLKEINEAYDQLRSGKARSHAATVDHRGQHVRREANPAWKVRWSLVLAPILIFTAVFLVTSRSLLRTRERIDEHPIPAVREVQTPPADAKQFASSEGLPKTSSEKESGETSRIEDVGEARASEPNLASVQPVPTVTVVIDPGTGKLARPHCPMKTSMTYPRGSEPHEYCPHRPAVPPLETNDRANKDSRVKSVAKRLLLQQ